MQQLYYDNTSSLYLIKDDGTEVIWPVPVTGLIISSSLNQIIAYSSSVVLAYFPTDNTDVFYPPFPNLPSIIKSQASVNNTVNVTSSIFIPVKYSLSGAFTNLDTSGSLLSIFNNTTSSSVLLVSGSNVNQVVNFITTDSYTVQTSRVSGSSPYTASLYIQDLQSSAVTSSYYIFSGSVLNSSISSSFTPHVNHRYSINSTISNSLIPVNYSVNFSSSYDSTTATGSQLNVYMTNPPNTFILTATQSNSTGTFGIQSGIPYTVQINSGPYVHTVTASLSIYNTKNNVYTTSQSYATGSYYYFDYIIPQIGDNYIISASFIATGSV